MVSDVNANIGISINAAPALAELKSLQRQLANFHSQVAKGSAASAAAQKNLQTNLLNAINATGKFNAQMGLVRTSTESFTHALENNKLSMGQYFKYAGASTKSFGKLFKNEFDTIGKVAEDRVKKMQTQYIKMGRDAQGATKAMAITPNTLNMKDVATQTALAAQKQALFNQLVKQGSTNLLNFGKNTQWAGRQLMVGFTVPLAYFGSMAAKTFMDLEAQAIRFKRVYGDMFTTTEETNKALANIQDLAKEFTKYGVAVTDTMQMAADAAATGKTGSDLTAQVAEATRLAVLGGVEQQQSLETTISLTNTFGIAAQDLKKNIDFLNAVENQTVVNIEDLTIAIPKAGPVIQQLGGDVKDLAFFLTAMKEGGINASEGANALKSGLASLINPTAKASAMLEGYGINVKKIVEGNAGNIKKTVVDFAQALDTLAPLDRARAIEQMFGKFQFARLSTLFSNVTKTGTQASRVLDLTGASIEELAILSERELKTIEDAVGTNFKASIEQLKIAIAPIGKTFLEAVTPIVKTLGTLFDKFNNLSDGTKKFVVIMTTVVGLIGPTLLMTFGLLANGVANIIKLFLSLRTGFLKLTGDSKSLGATTNYLTQEQLEAETVAASLNQAHSRLTQQFELEATAVMALRKAYVDATVAAANFARSNPGMMMPGKGGKTPKKFARGATYVPGTGNKDTVPSILTPGEAVIPKDVAQDPQFQPIIDAMVNGSLKKYSIGTANAGEQYSHVGKSKYVPIQELLTQPGLSELDKQKLTVYRDILKANNLPESISTRHNLAYSFPGADNRRMAGPGIPIGEFEEKWSKGGAGKWISSNIPASQASIVDDAMLQKIKEMGVKTVNDDIVAKAFETLPEDIKKTPSYQKMQQLYSKVGEYTIGKGLGDTPATTKAVLEQAKAQGLIKDYEVRERTNSKGKIANSGISITTKDGSRVDLGRGSSGQRNPLKDTQSSRRGEKTVAAKVGEYVYDPKTGKTTKITEQNTKPKSAGIKTTTRTPKDRRVLRIGKGRMILPGAETGLDANGNPLPPVKGGVKSIPFSDAAEQTRVKQSELKQAKAIENNIAATEESTKATRKFAGKMTTGINVVAGLNMVTAMAGGKIGEMAQKVMPFTILLSTLTMMGPSLVSGFAKLKTFLIANPWVAVIAALAVLTTMLIKMSKDVEKARQEGVKLANSMSMTSGKLQSLAEISGTVSASEAANARRENAVAGTTEAQRQYGQNILESDFGKGLMGDINSLTKAGLNTKEISKNIATQLGQAVVQGVITTEQARSIASALGEKLGDYEIPAKISGSLVQLLGPNGENLYTDPLSVALTLKSDTMLTVKDAFEQALTGANAAAVEKSLPLWKRILDAPVLIGQGGFTDVAVTKRNAQLDAAAVQAGAQAISQNQQLADSLAKQYDLKIKGAKTEKEALSFESEKKAKIDALNKANEKTFKDIQGLSDKMSKSDFSKAINTSIDALYKNSSDIIKTFVAQAKDAVGEIKDSKFKQTIQLGFASGELSASTILKILDYAAKDKTIQSKISLLIEKEGLANTDAIMQLFGKTGADAKTISIMLDYVNTNKESFDKDFNSVKQLADFQQAYGITLNLKTNGAAQIQNAARALTAIEKLPEKIDLQLVQKLAGENPAVFKGVLDNWSALSQGKDLINKNLVVNYAVGAVDPNLKKAASTAGLSVPEFLAKGFIAPAVVDTKSGAPIDTDTKTRDTTLDNLLNRLKMVRDASINATGGIKELNRVASGSGITKFSGAINQLMSGKDSTVKNRGFLSFIESMDNATRKTYMTIKNGNVVLTQAGKNLAEAFNEQTLGDFNTAQIDTITQLKAQQAAFVKLKSAGIDTATALEMVSDAELAIAINSSVEPANKLKAMAINAKEASDAVEKLNLAFKQQMASSVQELDMLKKLPDLVDQMNALGMNGEQVQAVLNNPDFAREMLNGLKDGRLISKDLVDYINSLPARKNIQIAIDMKTPEGMQSLFDKAIGNAQEYFNTLEAAINIKFKTPMKNAQKAVQDAQKAVQDVQDEINKIQDSIDVKQRNIEINITRKIEEYQADIDKIQESIKTNFDKPIEVLSNESNILSHDLSVMDKAAEGINTKYDEQASALSKISTINSQIAAQQKQQLTLADALTSGDISAAAAAAQDMRATQAADQISSQESALAAARDLEIANLRNAAGQTRAQIEDRQWQISEQTYTLEQGRKVLQDQIVSIEETKIAPLNAAKLIAERDIRIEEDKIYNLQVGKLANAEAEVIKKQDLLDKLQEEIDKQLAAIDLQRDKWIEAQSAIDVAKVKSEAFGETIKFNTSLVEKLAAAYAAVKPPSTQTDIKVDQKAVSAAQKAYDDELKTIQALTGYAKTTMMEDFQAKYPKGRPMMYGGMVKPMSYGGRVGSDSVNTLLTPGEFVMNKSATKAFGPMLNAINSSKYPSMLSSSNMTAPTYGDVTSTVLSPSNISTTSSVNNNLSSVYNYSVGITVNGSNSSADDIARAVMTQIKNVDSQRIRGQKQ